MKRSVQALSEETFDLLVIGGGVNGLATAWDAALRGLRVALVEQGDFGGATSSASLKIIHGGLRYLQHADFKRMRESIGERRHMLRMAPHLIEPLPFLIPTYGHGKKGPEAMRIALGLNDLISWDRNKGVLPERHLPRGYMISAGACADMAPMISSEGLTGGAIFYDGQMRNADRVTFSFARSAADAGAVLVNYCKAVRLIRDGNRIVAAEVEDGETGDRVDVKAACFVDMSGPWVDLLAPTVAGEPAEGEVKKSVGIQIATEALLEQPIGLAIESEYEDPDAKVSRGGRHYFTTPWRGKTLWGTTDRIFEGDPDQWRITDAEVDAFVAEINDAVPTLQLTREGVLHVFGGMRPMDAENEGEGSQVSRKAGRMDHASDFGIENWLSVEGVKYTTCRLTAEQTVDAVLSKLGRPTGACPTRKAVLWGGDVSGIDETYVDAVEALGEACEAVAVHLVDNYGAHWQTVAAESTLLTETLGDDGVTLAHVAFAVREEMALHLSDVLLRRTELGTLGRPADSVVDRVAAWMAGELGWDAARVQREKDAVDDAFRLEPLPAPA